MDSPKVKQITVATAVVRLRLCAIQLLERQPDRMLREPITAANEGSFGNRDQDWLMDGGLSARQLGASCRESSNGLAFPSTRYYGSKKKQLSWLREEFLNVQGKTVLDAFGGTGAVTHLWRSLGWSVTYNDSFTFNGISAKALFSDSTRLYPEKTVREFLESVEPEIGFIAETFSNLYFFGHENEWLDGLCVRLEHEDEAFRNLILHCAFQACLQKRPFNLFHRANLHLRTSTVEVKFGNRTTWARPFPELMLAAHREVAHMQASAMRLPVTVSHPAPASQIGGSFDVVYIDPPYLKQAKKTESYLERYHFLEGLARYREWPQLLDNTSALKRIRDDAVHEWACKNDFALKLNGLVEQHRSRQVILSYVSGEYPSETNLLQLFRDNFSHVRLVRRSFSRALSKKKFFEILLLGRP